MSRSNNEPVVPKPSKRRRSFLPRFGLKSLFLFAMLFCLFFAWLGKNAYRMRQSEAALEALHEADARIHVHGEDDWNWRTADDFMGYRDPLGQLIGWSKPVSVSDILHLESETPDDPKFSKALAALPTFQEIEYVSLRGRGVTDRSLAVLRRLPKLESVDFVDTEVTGAGLAQLGPPLSIREATFYGVPSPGLGLGLLTLEDLRVISFMNSTLDRRDIATIAALPKLEALQLQDIRFNDGAFSPLANAQGLKALYLYGGVADDDMATVAKLHHLEELLVHDITDAGLARLAPLTNLRRLELDSPVTQAAALKYSVENPECLVRHNTRGYRSGAPVDEETLPVRDRWPWSFPSNE